MTVAIASRGRALDLAFAALAAAQLGGAALLVPRGDAVALPGGAPLASVCVSRALFHVDCPFCGMTRSFVALAHGHLGAALGYHAAGPLLFAAMVIFVGAVAVSAIRGSRPLVERRRFAAAFESVALVCIAVGIIQMVRS